MDFDYSHIALSMSPARKWARPSHPPLAGRLLDGSLRSKIGNTPSHRSR